MSKYQKLDSAMPPTAHEDDCEAGFPLYFDDNQPVPGLEQTPAHRVARLSNVRRQFHSLNNNGLDSGDIATGIIGISEEQTWEVPLLGDSDDSASNQHSEHGRMEFNMDMQCRSRQPGFRANLKSKSAQEAKFKILLAVSLCCIFMVIEFLGGYVAGSLAIMTDAAHLASDCISFVIGLVAIWVGGRPPDERMSFGYKRFEVIGAVASIVGIWFLTTLLLIVAVQRIYSQDFELDVDMMMVISGIGIAINIVMMFILHGSCFVSGTGHGHSHGNGHEHNNGTSHTHSDSNSLTTTRSSLKKAASNTTDKDPNVENIVIINGSKPLQQTGSETTQNSHEEKNLNLRAAMIHVIGDLVQSIGVFLAAVLIKFCPSAKYVDPLCTLLFSIIVIMTTVQLFRESVSILVNAVPQNLSLRTLHCELASLEGVRSVHHLNVWQQTTQQRVMMVHLITNSPTDDNTVLQAASELVAGPRYKINHATIQIERTTA
ncbi:proton-coupled zinc antiporter SLC30A2 isoform X1 [Drosophila takahashii]|uniref:proton-coupled zinc antiporter SLC30A2 isoform X1 n=1 Tax=Drosophila takahashii TaxID=29030 RepID=UPI001CF8B9B6|nr:zinc transporter 2 isoform X1 [Drosophila takahashii]XP_044248642.1 zinc transporter 2 isoform X1 [Drosophila takahashii]